MSFVKLLEDGKYFEIQKRSRRSKTLETRVNSLLRGFTSTLQSEHATAVVEPDLSLEVTFLNSGLKIFFMWKNFPV